ncbi:energy transducer TonB [Aliidiomarina soli]|uniref:Energy transducer TonB n=1 Tax=Aliidiomarina soli TaxID=1928574 RepID=A0A432WLY6_9GAMM|nr:energy transducer TonB [Aliidiomarina soli]RUO34707.1 energy transducer TonB [Aliidiomarina soli]
MKLYILILATLVFAVGCTATPEKHLTQEPVEISGPELDEYWVLENNQLSFRTGNVDEPTEPGVVTVRYLIDSNGRVFEREIVESTPARMWDKFALNAMQAASYRPAASNPNSTPVYVTVDFEFRNPLQETR